MSWDAPVVHISTSPRGQRFQQAVGMFRMEEARPFDPGLLGLQAHGRRADAGGAGGAGGSRCRTAPTSALGTYSETDSETKSLLPRRADESRMNLSASITLCAALCLWLMVVSVLFAGYWTFTSNVAAMREQARPFVLEALNHTMSIIQHADKSTVGVSDVVDGARDITGAAVPALQAAMNRTSEMLARLEQLAQHPVLQLSLTQGAVAPVGR